VRVLILVATHVPPFDIKQLYVTEIEGVPMGTLIDWMKSCCYVTLTGLPNISVLSGFTPEGLPVVCSLWGATATISGWCNWSTPSSRQPLLRTSAAGGVSRSLQPEWDADDGTFWLGWRIN
jgi:hypothetical protein